MDRVGLVAIYAGPELYTTTDRREGFLDPEGRLNRQLEARETVKKGLRGCIDL